MSSIKKSKLSRDELLYGSLIYLISGVVLAFMHMSRLVDNFPFSQWIFGLLFGYILIITIIYALSKSIIAYSVHRLAALTALTLLYQTVIKIIFFT